MPASTCVRCGVVSDSVAESGLCATCLDQSDETQVVENAVGTVTHDLPTPATRSVGEDGVGGVLPPGGYRYVEPLGGGGMGVVWRAVRVSTGQTVAVKKLRPECFTPAGLQRFVAEARTLAAIRHANVVQLLDFVPDTADPFIVMEFVPGHSLSEQLKQSGPLHPDRAARLIAAAARGVQAAHDAGVIHRDLKPANLLLTPDGQVKVADFGLGKRLVEAEVAVSVGGGTFADDSPTTQGLTRTGHMAGGTPGFMAPEQVEEKYGRVDYTSDVWGLGACLYALLTNQSPFRGGKDHVQAVLTDSFLPLHEVNPAIPTDLVAIVVKCLQKDPGHRYPSALALADDLDRFVDRDSTIARPKAWPERLWRRLRRTPRAVVIAVAVAVVAVAVGGSLAMIPKWLQETPETIQEGYRKELRAGRPVTLIGEKGLPRHYRTWFGTPDLKTRADETCTFEVVGRALVELLDDPGIDAYTVHAEIRQTESRAAKGDTIPPGEGEVGLYVGFASTPDGGGGEFVTLLALGFADRDPNFVHTGKLEKQKVRSSAIIYFSEPNQRTHDAPVEVASTPFLPSDKRPGPWRTVEYHVTTRGHSPRWSPDVGGAKPLYGPPILPVTDYTLTQKNLDATFPGRGLTVPTWNPRAPLGLFAHSSAVDVRNVVITPDR